MVGNEQYVSWDGGVGLELVGQDDAYVGLPSSSPLRIAEDRHIEAPTIPSESRSRSYTQSDEAIPNLDEQSWLRETLGVEGTRKIEVVADSEGEYSMHLVLRPNWTTDDEPLSTVTVSVDVRPTHQLEGFSQRQLAKILAN
jgi:hypothetical protein